VSLHSGPLDVPPCSFLVVLQHRTGSCSKCWHATRKLWNNPEDHYVKNMILDVLFHLPSQLTMIVFSYCHIISLPLVTGNLLTHQLLEILIHSCSASSWKLRVKSMLEYLLVSKCSKYFSDLLFRCLSLVEFQNYLSAPCLWLTGDVLSNYTKNFVLIWFCLLQVLFIFLYVVQFFAMHDFWPVFIGPCGL
jgi:hypothetical protein